MGRGGARGAVVAAARGLAVHGDELRARGPGLAHPGGEGGREQGGADAVHQDCEPAPAGGAVLAGQVAAQEVQVGFAPGGDVVVVVAVGHGGAGHEQQHLGQGMGNAAHAARVVDGGEVVQQRAQAGPLRRRERKARKRKARRRKARRRKARGRRHGGAPKQGRPPSNQPRVKMATH